VKREPAVRRERLFDGEAGQLVPEGDGSRLGPQHPGRQTLVQTIGGFPGEGLQKPELGLRWDDRHGVEELPRRQAEPRGACEHGVTDGVRNLVLSGRQNLRHEERIAARVPVELVGIQVRRLGKLGDGRRRERLDLQTADDLVRRELAEHDPERMGAVDLVVAVAGENERGDRLEPSRQQPEDVERRLVGPVDVLEDEDRRRRGRQLAGERGRHLVWPRAGLDEALELAARPLGDLEQRPERSRSEEGIAGAPEDSRRVAVLVAEAPQQRRLPTAGLAADEHQAAVRALGDGGQRVSERRQMARALEQLARRLGRAGSWCRHSHGATGRARRPSCTRARSRSSAEERATVMIVASVANASLTPPETRVVTTFVRLLEAELGPDLLAVWLYGSRARGEVTTADSDVDLLVVVDRAGRSEQRRVIDLVFDAAEAEGANPATFSAKLYSPELLAERRAIRSFFIQEVDRDKIVLAGEP
jgi:predicted nucleotidyltransferase